MIQALMISAGLYDLPWFYARTACLTNQDVRLGADPNLADGGKTNGFGSLWEYQVRRLCV
jgi:hypothetical protein